MSRIRHLARLGAFMLACAFAAHAAAASHEPPPLRIDPLVEQFLQPINFSYLHLSPDGKHLAEIASANDDTFVMMVDTTTLAGNFVAKGSVAANVNHSGQHRRKPIEVFWLTNDLVAVNYDDISGEVRHIDGRLERNLGGGVFSQLHDDQGNATDWVLIRSKNRAKWLERQNIVTGEQLPYDVGVPGWKLRPIVDRRGDLRVVQVEDTELLSDVTSTTTWYRPSADAPWEKVDERPNKDLDFIPLFVPAQPGHLDVLARHGGDRRAVWDYDLAKHAFGVRIAGDDTDDLVSLEFSNDAASAVSFESDGMKRRFTWLDPRMAELQAWVDSKLPDHVNMLNGSPDSPLLVTSYSDVDPGHAYVVDPRARTIKLVLNMRPDVDVARMQPMQMLHYPAADGLPIPAYLTLPGKPTKPVPLIVLIHGGPVARDYWQWDEEVQLFAAHGYAVLQPQFRGSSGFGKRFEEAGYEQWGRLMQDDVSAGVRDLVARKIVDPARVCIVGGSYGGYAALWGLASTPELYKCGVDLAGVSDIENQVTDYNGNAGSGAVREIWTHTIGDRKTMHDAWAEVSPLRHADRIQAPLLIVHGDEDPVVPIAAGKKMRDALADHDKDVQWLEFEAEGHGVRQIADRRLYYGAMLELFARTIGEAEPPFAPTDATVKKAKDLAAKNGQQVWLPRTAATAAAPAASQATASAH